MFRIPTQTADDSVALQNTEKWHTLKFAILSVNNTIIRKKDTIILATLHYDFRKMNSICWERLETVGVKERTPHAYSDIIGLDQNNRTIQEGTTRIHSTILHTCKYHPLLRTSSAGIATPTHNYSYALLIHTHALSPRRTHPSKAT
jgi:hypothetical protein